ncbi:MAG: hypothetical protein EB084_12275 [Proteobacteria bacterium]|nr:hypothetical protein [Pseudomonadota bacterium]
MTSSEERVSRLVTRAMAWLADFCDRRAGLVIWLTFIVFAFTGVYTQRFLGYASDRSIVLATSAPYYHEYQAFKREFGASDALFFVVRSPDPAKNHAVALEIGRAARANTKCFSNVVDLIDLSFARKRALLFVSSKELEQLAVTLREARPLLEHLVDHPGLTPLFVRVNNEVQAWMGAMMRAVRLTERPRDDAQPGPGSPQSAQVTAFMQALPVFTNVLDGMRAAIDGTPVASPLQAVLAKGGSAQPADAGRDLWLEFKHGETVLVSAEARIAGDRADAVDAAVEAARQIIEETRARHPEVELGVTGTPAIDSDEMRQSKIDSFRATLLSLLGVVLLFWGAFHNLTRPLLALVALIVSLVYTLAFVTLTLGHLNLLTVTALPMLVGLGIDFGIQVISRYEEERNAGLEPTSAMSDTLQFTGASIITAGLTTAVSFGVVYFSGFVGVQEMAIVAGAGIIIGVFCMTVVLPSFILAGERSRFRKASARAMRASSWQALEALEKRVLRRPGVTLMVGLAFTGLCTSNLSQVRYDWNPLHLQDPSSPSVSQAMQLMAACDRSILWAAVTTDTPTQARALTDRFRSLESVGDVLSIAPLIPPNQPARIEVVGRIQRDLAGLAPRLPMSPPPAMDVKALCGAIRDLRRVALVVYPEAARMGGPAAGEAVQAFVTAGDQLLESIESAPKAAVTARLNAYQQKLFSELGERLTMMLNPLAATPVTVETLPEALRRQFVGRNGQFMVQVFPSGNVWERPALAAFIEQVRGVSPSITGPAVEMYESTVRVKTGYERVTVYALIAIVILTLLHFQSIGATILALTPLGLGVLWMTGIQGIIGLPFNGANELALSLILGIGVANGIYIVRRYHEEGRATIFTQSTGRAILLSNLAALVGFGSLLVSAYRGMFTFGLLMSIGVITCMVASLVMLPAMLSLPRFRRPDAKDAVSEDASPSRLPQG